jgi:hypothetical protein
MGYTTFGKCKTDFRLGSTYAFPQGGGKPTRFHGYRRSFAALGPSGAALDVGWREGHTRSLRRLVRCPLKA